MQGMMLGAQWTIVPLNGMIKDAGVDQSSKILTIDRHIFGPIAPQGGDQQSEIGMRIGCDSNVPWPGG
ncbi:hypothetical protein CBM2606_A10144 [Cupriavidus taiwanensis]|uniref:hypothetical protein n=1 Tax=Cupriavidus taiwanensis TaxID=164546 RepID=UPI000E19FD5D|nr:hypothetical protein [Cupriavidus taiwanensis]SPA36240.1 hypothetical protein CBM2606_A10144 [Cupriavidus taiwanensis]